jgi:HTH-type transcriptional regulator, sugar sensing transcriptional regulator
MIIDKADHPYRHLIKDLQGVGFSDYEAKAYIALLRLQTATAYEVSKDAGLPKANGYTVLESLTKKGAVQPISTSPARFMAIPPRILFKRIAEGTERLCDRLVGGLSRLDTIPREEFVWQLTDRNEIRSKIDQMIAEARTHIWVKGSENLLEPHCTALKKASRRGICIRIILFGSRLGNFDFGSGSRTWLHEGNGMPVGMSTSLLTITRDYEEALIVDLGNNAHGSHTRSRPIVNLADTLIRHEIYFAEIFERFGNEIQEEFGPALYRLRASYLPKEQVDDLRKLLVDTDATTAESLSKPLQKNSSRLGSKVRRGVSVSRSPRAAQKTALP